MSNIICKYCNSNSITEKTKVENLKKGIRVFHCNNCNKDFNYIESLFNMKRSY